MSLSISYTFAAGLLFSVSSLQSSLDGCSVNFLPADLPRVSSFCEILYCLHFILQINTANLFLDVCVFTYPLPEIHKATRSSECYAAFLLAPAEG